MHFVDMALKTPPIACALFPSDGKEHLGHQWLCAMMPAVDVWEPGRSRDACCHKLPKDPEPLRRQRMILPDDESLDDRADLVRMSIDRLEERCERRRRYGRRRNREQEFNEELFEGIIRLM